LLSIPTRKARLFRIQILTLELFVTALAEAGAKPLADLIAERYLDFRPANEALEAMLAG